jgi:hypothetical protein
MTQLQLRCSTRLQLSHGAEGRTGYWSFSLAVLIPSPAWLRTSQACHALRICARPCLSERCVYLSLQVVAFQAMMQRMAENFPGVSDTVHL